MASLKVVLAVQETDLILAGAAQNEAEQGRQRLDAECQKLHAACGGEFSSILCYAFVLLYLVVNQLLSSGLHARVLSDQEEKAAINQRVLEMGDQLAALTVSNRALCDIVLGNSWGNAQLAFHLGVAHL